MHGILIVEKPEGPTSHDIISIVRRAAKQKKVGHTGTLDPAASGVMVVCLGNATRIIEYLMDWDKEYVAEATFGAETSTQDQTGEITNEVDCSGLTRDRVEAILPKFIGKIEQIPPMVSAVHHQGKRLYEIARAGITVERASREIEIYSLSLEDFTPGARPTALFKVCCSKGTYIRTLCADIGEAVGGLAFMSKLVRTRVGPSRIEDAASIDEIRDRGIEGSLSEILMPIESVLSEIQQVHLSEDKSNSIAHGMQVRLDRDSLCVGNALMFDPSGSLLGVGLISESSNVEMLLKLEKVFSAVS